MRIHFGIYNWSAIKWPKRCLSCGAGIYGWRKISKRTFSGFEYRILWFNVLSRRGSLSYPVCEKHYSAPGNDLLIHKVNKDFIEISIPEGEYAEDFALLNNCTIFDGHRLMQDPEEIVLAEFVPKSGFSDDRILCSDESCVGIIEDGKCTECGRKG